MILQKRRCSSQELYRSHAQTLIVTDRLATPKIEIRNRKIGYDFYSLEALGIYSVAVRVDNTAIYAYCDVENKAKLNQILDDRSREIPDMADAFER